MCNFLSLVSTPQTGGIHYFNLETRKSILENNNLSVFDSHWYICKHFNLDEDKSNKYEYDVFTKELIVDQQNAKTLTGEIIDDKEKVKAFINGLETRNEIQDLIESGLYKLDYSKLKTIPKGLVLPEGIEDLSLRSLTSAEGLVLPEGIQRVDLNSLTSAEGLVLPEGIQRVDLSSLTSAQGLVLPEGIQWLDLRSLTSAQGLVLPEGIQNLYLNSEIKEWWNIKK